MTSSFRRNIKKTDESNGSSGRIQPGVKPWFNCGLGLVSSGNRQLDDSIGGGYSLGTLSLIGTDSISNFGHTILLYNTAESTSIGHNTLIVAYRQNTIDNILNNLPHNSHFKSSTAHHSSSSSVPSDITADEQSMSTVNMNDLKSASGYAKYIGKTSSYTYTQMSSLDTSATCYIVY